MKAYLGYIREVRGQREALHRDGGDVSLKENIDLPVGVFHSPFDEDPTSTYQLIHLWQLVVTDLGYVRYTRINSYVRNTGTSWICEAYKNAVCS